MKISPCKDCTKRYLGCHGSCEEFIEYKKLCAKISENRVKQQSLDTYFINSYYKKAQTQKQLDKRDRRLGKC